MTSCKKITIEAVIFYCIVFFSLYELLVCTPRPAIQAGSTVSVSVPVRTPKEVGWFSFTCPVFSTCPGYCLRFWHTVMALGPPLRKLGARAGISAVSSRLSRWQLRTSFSADAAHSLLQPSANAPSQAASFPAITPALKTQKNWPTPAVGFCISEICATRCTGFYTADLAPNRYLLGRQDGCPTCWWAICSSRAARLPAARLDLLLLVQSTRAGKCIRIPRFCPDRIYKMTKRTCWENKGCSHCEVQKYCCLHLSRERNKTQQNSGWLTHSKLGAGTWLTTWYVWPWLMALAIEHEAKPSLKLSKLRTAAQ